MNKYIIMFGLCCCCMASCIKDEAQNKECDIESAWIEGAEYEAYFYQNTEMRKEISSAETDIVFNVRSLMSLPTQIPLNFKITDGATIEPANGSMQDFTKGTVAYAVTSQDGEWRRIYNAIFQKLPLPAEKYSFEHYDTDPGDPMLGYVNEMHVFYELMANDERYYCWATGNIGSALTKNGSKPEEFPVYSTPDGKVGRGICLNTQSAGMMGEWMKKPIAAGSLFLGKFQIDYVLTDALKSTWFGVPVSKEPVRIKGWYKYQPGEKFTDMNMTVYPDRKDEASIYAVFYRNTDEKGEAYTLDSLQLRARAGYSIGGTAPIPLPETIRSIDSYSLMPSFLVGFDATLPLTQRWGIMTGLRFENKGMKASVTTKAYYMEVVKGNQKMSGLFTGHVEQEVKQWMLTLPVQATFTLSPSLTLKGGPYASLLLSKEFSGIASDGYLGKDSPTGPKILMGNREGEWATYDFNDDMRRLQFGIAIGLDWQFHDRLGVSADLNWGLTGIFPSDFKTVEQTLYPIYGTIGVFYRLK